MTVAAPLPADFAPGLEGVTAFATEIAEPDKDGGSLRYRGVDIEDLVAQRVTFGDVWALLVDGKFGQGLPPAEPFPIPVHTGDVRVDVQAGLAMLAPIWGFEPLLDTEDSVARNQLARASVMALSYVAQSARGNSLPAVPQKIVDECSTVTSRFMTRWQGDPDPKHVEAIDAYWVSAAEHGMNASTFTARVIASTGADVAASLSGAVGAMSGPLHGGAPARVLPMIEQAEKTGDARGVIRGILDRRESSWASATGCIAPKTRVRGCCAAPPSAWAPRAMRLPPPLSRLPWPSCGNAAPIASSRPMSSSGRRSFSTSRRCRRG